MRNTVVILWCVQWGCQQLLDLRLASAGHASPGAQLALLLLGGFESLTARVIAELAEKGHPGVTATHEFALRAIDRGAADAAALGRELGVSRQAAAKTIEALEEMGYLQRTPDPRDARRKRLVVTARGYDMSSTGGAAFDALRAQWAAAIGTEQVKVIEAALRDLISRSAGDSADAKPDSPAGRRSRPITRTRRS